MRGIRFVVGLTVLYYGLSFIGMVSVYGEEYSSPLLAQVTAAPFSLMTDDWEFLFLARFFFWPTVTSLLALRRFPACRIAAAVALALHGLGAVMVSGLPGSEGLRRAWNAMPPGWFAVCLIIYLSSQAFMWSLITPKRKS